MNSISQLDNDYLKICKLAINDDNYFSIFKSDQRYTKILEHTSFDQGYLYYKNIQTNFPEYKEYLDKLILNDSLGSPKRYQYEDIDSISPSLLRYIKVASDIKNIFKDKINLNNAKIIEIGCGYGGQCFVLNQLFNIQHYYIVDIPEAQKLANKYLQKLNIKNYTIVPIENLSNITDEYDLVISNYAYSELDKNFQDYYYDHIIKKSKHGYLTFNFISSLFNIDSYSKEEIIDKFNQHQTVNLLNEEPKTHKDNFIIYF